MNFVLRVIGIFIAVAVAVWLVPGIEVGGTVSTWASVLIIALIIALLNMTIKPILQLLGLPITVITLGIFYIIINTALALSRFMVGEWTVRHRFHHRDLRVGIRCEHRYLDRFEHHERAFGSRQLSIKTKAPQRLHARVPLD